MKRESLQERQKQTQIIPGQQDQHDNRVFRENTEDGLVASVHHLASSGSLFILASLDTFRSSSFSFCPHWLDSTSISSLFYIPCMALVFI